MACDASAAYLAGLPHRSHDARRAEEDLERVRLAICPINSLQLESEIFSECGRLKVGQDIKPRTIRP